MIVFVAIALPVGLTAATLWPQLKLIFAIVGNGPSAATRVLLGFVREELRELEERVADIRTKGLELEPGAVSPWVNARCFGVGSGTYRTTDVLVPSRFIGNYYEYLKAHSKYLERHPGMKSTRINVASLADLGRDRVENADRWAQYRDWHARNGVELRHCDLEIARDIASQEGLGTTVDVALWEGELALLVEYHANGKTNLRIALVGEPWYRRCERYLQRVTEEATLFDVVEDMADASVATPQSQVSQGVELAAE